MKILAALSSLAALALAPTLASQDSAAPQAKAPNVILIVTDDQGGGDFGFAGNPVLETPNLDRLAAESTRIDPFYVCPVCAPTRASLFTGRYHYRTRVVDTYVGRAMMDPAEVTLAEELRKAGYATGIFGKWHLGDCYPMRPQDQGFDEALVHRGGGIGQPADPLGAEGRYTHPTLMHNGVETQIGGYCTDIFFDRAIDWMKTQRETGKPFFCAIPTNAPHGPYGDVPQDLLAKYRKLDLSNERFPTTGRKPEGKFDADRRARIYAMIGNIDQGVGRLLSALREMGAERETLVLFLCDNGPQTQRYVAGLRGKKGTVYEGGIRTPFLARWPGRLSPGRVVDRVSAHIDVLPTVLDACGVPQPKGRAIDGHSAWDALEGNADAEKNPRTLVIQAHRGNTPEPFHNFALREGRWKLVRPTGFGKQRAPKDAAFELYDLIADPFEQNDLAAEKADVVARLRASYSKWWEDVSHERSDNFAPPRIVVGSDAEPVTVLTRQDWRVNQGSWGGEAMGVWELTVERDCDLDITVHLLRPAKNSGELLVRIAGEEHQLEVSPGQRSIRIDRSPAAKGDTRLEVRHTGGKRPVGVYQVEIRRRSRSRLDLRRLEESLSKVTNGRNVPGLAVAVFHDGRELLARGFGMADIERGLPVTPDTAFGIGSVTKQFAAAVLLELQEQGRLSLDDHISDRSHRYPVKFDQPVTVRQLLYHVSGLPQYTGDDRFWEKEGQAFTEKDIMALITDGDLRFDPDSDWEYNNSGYYVAGLIAEDVSGLPLGTLVRDLCAKPIGSATLRCSFDEVPDGLRAVGYTLKAGQPVPCMKFPDTAFGAAGTMVGSVRDLVRWNELLHTTDRLITRESYAEMTKRHAATDTDYGLGVQLTQQGKRKRIEHTGLVPGFTAVLQWYPAERLSVAMLANSDRAEVVILAANVGLESLRALRRAGIKAGSGR